MVRFIKIGSIILATMAVIIIALIVTLPYLIDSTAIKTQVARALSQKMGRDIGIGGPIDLKLFPTPRIRMVDVSMASPPEYGGTKLVNLEFLDIQLKFLPLLSKRVEVQGLEAKSAYIHLIRSKKGKWNFEGMEAGKTISKEQGPTKVPPEPIAFSAQRLRVTRSNIKVEDHLSQKIWEIKDISIESLNFSLESPIKVTIKGSLEGLAFKINLDAGAISGYEQGKDLPIKLLINFDKIGELNIQGTIKEKNNLLTYQLKTSSEQINIHHVIQSFKYNIKNIALPKSMKLNFHITGEQDNFYSKGYIQADEDKF